MKLRAGGPEAPLEKILTLWLHLVCIMYFIGRPEFVEAVLLCPPDWEQTGLPGIFEAFLTGRLDNYTPALAARLRTYGLTRQSLRRWFDWTGWHGNLLLYRQIVYR